MPARYGESLKNALSTGTLLEHVRMWAAVWEVEEQLPYAGHASDILAGNISPFDIRRLWLLISGACENIDEGDSLAIDLLCPIVLLHALIISKEYIVAFGTALHQGFCNETDHFDCF